jgi:hypothetical protein
MATIDWQTDLGRATEQTSGRRFALVYFSKDP